MCPGGKEHAKKHPIDDTRNHKPVSGVVGDNIVVIDPTTKLPIKDSGTSLASILGGINIQGSWDANTNTPALASGVGVAGNGYIVGTAGSTNLDGITDWKLKDIAWFDGVASVWRKIDNTQDAHDLGGALHIADTLANLNLKVSDATLIAEVDILEPKQAAGIFVSNAKGSDVTGDGSLFRPFATINAAITYGIAQGYTIIPIVLDVNSGPYVATIPDGQDVAISALQGLISSAPGSITSIIVGSGLSLFLDNLKLTLIKESSGMINSTIYVEECLVKNIKDFAETGFATALTGVFANTFCELGAELDIVNMLAYYGNGIDWETGETFAFKGIDNRGNKIVNQAAGSADTDGANTKQLDDKVSFSESINVYHVSNDKGDDTNGDGSPLKPLKTINAAIAAGVTAGLVQITIKVDFYTGGYDATIPAGESVCMIGSESFFGYTFINTVIVGNGAFVQIDNINVTMLKQASSFSSASVVINDSLIIDIKDFAETGYATLMTLLCNGAWVDDINDVLNVSSAKGIAIDSAGKVYALNGLDANTNKITNVVDPTANQDAATKKYVDDTVKKTQPFGFDALGSTSTTYLKHGSIIFLGTTKMGSPTKIYANAYRVGGTSYNIRIIDKDNGDAVIAEVTGLVNTTEAIQDLGAISNLPAGMARWELQLQRVGSPVGNIVSSGGLIEW